MFKVSLKDSNKIDLEQLKNNLDIIISNKSNFLNSCLFTPTHLEINKKIDTINKDLDILVAKDYNFTKDDYVNYKNKLAEISSYIESSFTFREFNRAIQSLKIIETDTILAQDENIKTNYKQLVRFKETLDALLYRNDQMLKAIFNGDPYGTISHIRHTQNIIIGGLKKYFPTGQETNDCKSLKSTMALIFSSFRKLRDEIVEELKKWLGSVKVDVSNSTNINDNYFNNQFFRDRSGATNKKPSQGNNSPLSKLK